jgi:hypothetical protein
LHNRAGFHAERSQRTTAGATALPGLIHIDRGLSRTGLPMLFPARLLGRYFSKALDFIGIGEGSPSHRHQPGMQFHASGRQRTLGFGISSVLG